MPTPIPTPFDITEIPVIAWVPGSSTWMFLIISTLAAIFATKLLTRSKTQAKAHRVSEQLLAEMQADVDSGRNLPPARYARAARRILEHISKKPLNGLSGDEINALASGNPNTLERMALLRLAAIESTGYEPPSPQKESEQRDGVLELLSVLRQLLESSGAR